MKSLETKIAYLDENYQILDRNKEFYTYFEKAGFLYENIEDIVRESERQNFMEFVKTSRNRSEFRAYPFRKITGEYQYNIVYICEEIHNEKNCIAVHIIDISKAYDFYTATNSSQKKMNYALGLTNEYVFSYQKSNNIFTLYNFLLNKRIVVYEQELESWIEQIIEEGLIYHENIDDFRYAMLELKSCQPIFSTKVNSSIRYTHSLFENLIFTAIRVEDNDDIFMIGRIMPEIYVEQSDKSTELMQELKLDALTGVYNKKAITRFAQKRFSKGTKENAMLVIVDLDHFKPVNDAYGHLAGDKVLRKAGDVLRNAVSDVGVIGRYGGDEFLVVLEDMNEESVFRGVLRSFVVAIENAFKDMFVDIQVTASVGASMYPKDGSTFDELFKKADFCLYRAKDKGRNRYVFFRDDLHGELYKKASEAKTEGIKYDVREVLELKSMADFLLQLGSNPKPAAETVLAHMLKTYNLDSINFYYKNSSSGEMERKYCLGEQLDSLKTADYIFGSEFKTALAGKPYIRMNYTTELREIAKPLGKILFDKGVKSTILCVLGSVENPKGLITFDRIKEGALWAEYEVNCCVMFAAAVNLLPEEKIQEIFA